MTIFLTRLPAALERRVSVQQLIHIRCDRATVVLHGSSTELQSFERDLTMRFESSLQQVVAAYLREVADPYGLYVLEHPFVAIREYQPVRRSTRTWNEYERQVFADIECDIQVYAFPSQALARTASSNFLETRS